MGIDIVSTKCAGVPKVVRNACVVCLFALVTTLSVATANASPAVLSACRAHYLGGLGPTYSKLARAKPVRELCFSAFAIMHSGATRTPLWSAENLTAISVASAETITRIDHFHAEPKLPLSERSELSDYKRSGYDRGHMTPAGDEPNEVSQDETFSLANMIPQNHKLNTGLWAQVEATVRDVATADGEVWIVTGPLFQGADIQAIGGNTVLVPTQVWKAVYDPMRKGAAVYVADNSDNPNCRIMSVTGFQSFSGINPFPALPTGTKRLPLTQPRGCRQEGP